MRRDKTNYYLDLAEVNSNRGTCRRRNWGAVIVNDDTVVSNGYTGAPHGRKNCCDMDYCRREKLGVPSGQQYELCRSIHAEQNAILCAAKERMIGATLYLVGKDMSTNDYVPNGQSCAMCKRFIINAGIKEVIVRNDKDNYTTFQVQEWIDNDDTDENSWT